MMSLLSALVLGVAATPHTPAYAGTTDDPARRAAPAPTCSGAGCTGRSPKKTGCDWDARTYRTYERPGGEGPTYRLRYSSRCHTVWVQQDTGDPNWRVKIQIKGGVSYIAHASYAGRTFTSMVYSSLPYRVCGEMYTGRPNDWACTQWM